MTTTEKLRAEFETKLAKAEREDSIVEAVKDLGLTEPRMTCVSELYGTCASLHYGEWYRRYNQTDLSWETVLALAEKLPGVPITKVRDGCLSFQPTSYVESLPEEKKERWKEETSVCPLLVKVDCLHEYGPRLELNWTANLPSVGLVRVDCEFSHVPQKIGTYSAKRIDYRGGWRYEKATFKLNEKLDRIEAKTPADTLEHIAEAQLPIHWASGSPQNPGSVSIYWIDIHSDRLTTTADIVRAMKSAVS